MLTRIYIDNYKCFTDFTLTFDSINLLLGPNGSGKSSIFQALYKLREFIALQKQAGDLFFAFESTRWSQRKNQTFGLEFAYQGEQYHYHLEIQFDQNALPSVRLESLSVNQQQLVRFENQEVYLLNRSAYPLEANRSAIASIPKSSGLEQLSTFRQLLTRILLVQVVPPIMAVSSSDESASLLPDSRNWLSWYRFVSRNQNLANELKEYLAEIFTGFTHFQFVDIGIDSTGKSSKGLRLNFSTSQAARGTGSSFAELSDGERALIVLYALLVYAKREGYLLCLDEPENFLALAEIQPWLVELYMLCQEGEIQALLISHHPEIINYLGRESSIWLERADDGSVVVQPVIDEANTGLPFSELVARGWLGA